MKFIDPMALLRETEVLELRPESRSTLLNTIADGTLPGPTRPSPRVRAWPRYEIELCNHLDLAASRMTERQFRAWAMATAEEVEGMGLPVGAWYLRRVEHLVEGMVSRDMPRPGEYSWRSDAVA